MAIASMVAMYPPAEWPLTKIFFGSAPRLTPSVTHHLTAIAAEAGTPFRIDLFDELSDAAPVIVESWHDDFGYYYTNHGVRIDVPSPWGR